MKRLIIFILLSSILLSGCNYGIDIDEQSFVIAVGVEKGKAYKLRTTFVFCNPSEGGGGEKDAKSGSAAKSTDIVTIEAPSVFSAIRQLNGIKSKKINLTHTKLVVFSEELAREGIEEYINSFASSRDFRPNTYICISEGSSDKYLRNVKPVLESYIEKYYDHIIKKVASDKVNEAYLYYLYFNLAEKYSGSVVPLVGINKNSLPKEDSPQTIESDDFAINEKPGDILRKAENEAEVFGSAIFRNGKMVLKIGSFYSNLVHLIGNEFYPDNYTFRDKESGEFVTVKVTQDTRPEIKSSIKNGKAIIRIKVPIEMEYVDPSVIDTPKKSDKFKKYITSVFNKKVDSLIKKSQTKYDCDLLGLGEFLKKHFIDYKEWEKFNWEQKYKEADIKITFKIRFADYEEINH